MIIQCPQCSTRFRLAERAVGHQKLKCSRCRHIFTVPRTQRPQADPPRRGGAPKRRKELQLSFDEPEWHTHQPALPLETPDDDFSIDEQSEPAAPDPGRGRRSGAEAAEAEDVGTLTIESDDSDDDDAAQRSAPPAAWDADDPPVRRPPPRAANGGRRPPPAGAADDDDEDDDEAADDEPSHDEPPRARREDMNRRRASVTSIYVFFAAAVGVYFFITRALIGNPAITDRLVTALPFVGNSLAADRLLFRKVSLADLHGAYVQLKGGREVFVVTGNAVNTAARPLRGVQVQATLFDDRQRELSTQVASCGGVLTQRMLRELSVAEVEMLTRVEPARPVLLAPGESVPFAIVFFDPPKGVTEYVSRVASARRVS